MSLFIIFALSLTEQTCHKINLFQWVSNYELIDKTRKYLAIVYSSSFFVICNISGCFGKVLFKMK